MVLFQMWGRFREYLIERHRFYVSEASGRLLGQFADIEGEADKAADAWLARQAEHFDPELHDPADAYEGAQSEKEAFYELLTEMAETTRLGVVAGMYHEWEKQLRNWMVDEIVHWHHGSEVRARVWKQDIVDLLEFFAALGWDIQAKPYFPAIDACRVVVNVYKHGEGPSFNEMKERYPQYIANQFLLSSDQVLGMMFANFRDLRVTDAHIQEFSDAIVAFWSDVPENIFRSQASTLPAWFEKAFLKDRGAAK